MTNTPHDTWLPCLTPAVADTLRWREPIWAKPSKPRGKLDKIGEQMITAKLISLDEVAELQVIDVTRLSLMEGVQDEPSKINSGDMIRRKLSSIKMGECQKLAKGA